MKRKLMLISPMLHQGGFERVCVTTARLLEPHFDITIVIFDSADIAYDVSGLHIVDIQMGVKRGVLGKAFNILKRSHRVRQLKKQLKPDVSYSFGPSANMVNAFSKTGKEKVWLGLRSYMDVRDKGKIKLFTKFADLIICCSKTIEIELKNKYKFNKTTTLYNPYDVKTIQRQAKDGKILIPWEEFDSQGREIRCLASMGREDDLKGFWHMLKVFSLVHSQIPEARLLILGEGSFEEYRKLAVELNISDEIYFAGMQRVPYRYLMKAEIYLLTSLTEGFPNALVEGMALGLAAVSTNCLTGPAEILLKNYESAPESKTASSEIYGDYGILLPPMTEEKDLDSGHILPEEELMAKVILKLLTNDDLLQKYQKAAMDRAQDFTYERYVQQILDLAASPVPSPTCEPPGNMIK